MKVLITGASGMLGTDVWKVFSNTHERVAMGRTQPRHVPLAQWRACDLRDAAATYATVTRENPDLIVHCASYNDVDGAEAHPDDAYQVNALGTRNLALACQRFDTVLMSLSTDYVFGGDHAPKNGYREFDPTHPLGVYAQSKRWGELFVEQLLSKFFIVRTSWLFGEARASFAERILSGARENKPIPCFEDQCSSPTFTADLAEALRQLAESNLYGLYHITNSGLCTRVDFAREVLRLHHLPETLLRPTTQSDVKMKATRPAFSGLQNLAWTSSGFKPLRPWQDALKAYFGAVIPTR